MASELEPVLARACLECGEELVEELRAVARVGDDGCLRELAAHAANILQGRLVLAPRAEIHGLDLQAPLDAGTIEAVRAEFVRFKVLFFPEAHLSHEDHVRFSRYFGAPTIGHVKMR